MKSGLALRMKVDIEDDGVCELKLTCCDRTIVENFDGSAVICPVCGCGYDATTIQRAIQRAKRALIGLAQAISNQS